MSFVNSKDLPAPRAVHGISEQQRRDIFPQTSTSRHTKSLFPCSLVMYPPPMLMPQPLNVTLDLLQR